MSDDRYLTKECIILRDLPDDDKEPCEYGCFYMLVYLGHEYREWRCRCCHNYLTVRVAKPEHPGQRTLF